MKKMLFFLCLTASSFVSFSQQTDARLLAVYTEQELTELKQGNLELFNAITYGLTNATYIIDKPKGKETSEFPSIKLPKTEYTFASLGLKIINDQNQFFHIEGTDKMLVVKSGITLSNELKNKK